MVSFCLLSNHLATGVKPEDEDEFMEDMELGPPYDGKKPVVMIKCCLINTNMSFADVKDGLFSPILTV